jgi:hypothetical protein
VNEDLTQLVIERTEAQQREITSLQDKIKQLRAWIDQECPACGGLVAFDATHQYAES